MPTVMSGLPAEEDATTLGGTLCPKDFPPGFKDGQHPDDYQLTDIPIDRECIFHSVRGTSSRLWLRVSWQLSPGVFVPMSFLLDASRSNYLWLTDKAFQLLEEHQLVNTDEDLGLSSVTLFGRQCRVDTTHGPANVMGLKMLMRLGLALHESKPHFSFSQPLPYLSAEK